MVQKLNECSPEEKEAAAKDGVEVLNKMHQYMIELDEVIAKIKNMAAKLEKIIEVSSGFSSKDLNPLFDVSHF